MKAKQFMYTSMGVLLLVGAYQPMISSAHSQTGIPQPIGIAAIDRLGGGGPSPYVLFDNGDVWMKDKVGKWIFQGNPLAGTVIIESEDWSNMKGRFRGKQK